MRKDNLSELERAVGPWPWRVEQIAVTSGKPISRKMMLILALVIFDNYELFPGRGKNRRKKHDARPQKPRNVQ